MDIKECIKILSDRQSNSATSDISCPCCKPPESYCSPSIEKDERAEVLNESELSNVGTVVLIDALLHVQESRVKIYYEYNKGLDDLLQSHSIESYPILCQSMTTAFNRLSESAIRLKEEMRNRSLNSLVLAIETIQKAEKDKLLYVAAYHLDQLQAQLPSLQGISGDCEVQRNYLRGKIQECETTISEQIQEIQSIKIENIELENT